MATIQLARDKALIRAVDNLAEHVNAINAVNDIDFALCVITTHVTKLHQHESGYAKAVDANAKLYGLKAYDHKTAASSGFMIMLISFITCVSIDTTPFVYFASLLCAFILGYMKNIWCVQRDFLRDKRKIQQSIINTFLYNIDKEKCFIDRETKIIQDTYPELDGYFHTEFIAFAKDFLRSNKQADIQKTIEAYNARNTKELNTTMEDSENSNRPN